MLSRPISFLVAALVGGATLTAASAPSPLYPEYQRLWGFSTPTLTAIFAVYVFALLAALLTVGSLSDQVGRRPMASASLLLLAAGMVLFALADGTGDLFLARIVQGLAAGAAASTTTAMILDSAPAPAIGSVVSSAAPPLGIGIGAILSGALVELAPHPRQLVFWILAGVYAVLAVVVWAMPEHGRDGRTSLRTVLRALRPEAGLGPVVRPVFLALTPVMVATWALGGLYLSLGSSVVGSVIGVDSHLFVGLILGSFFLAGAAGSAIASTLPARHGEPFGVGMLAVGVTLTVVASLITSTPAYVVGSVVAGVGFGASFRLVVDALGSVAPEGRRGQVFTTMYIVSYLAFSVPALVAGLAVDVWGLRPTVVGYGLVELGLLAAAVVATRRRKRSGSSDPLPELDPEATA